jgi:integrase
MNNCLCSLKRKLLEKCKEALSYITFKSYRHLAGLMIAHRTNGNVLIVEKMLLHKSILNTMKYIHTVNFANSDFEEAAATTNEEIGKHGKKDGQNTMKWQLTE